jgi:acetyl esterase/lipase
MNVMNFCKMICEYSFGVILLASCSPSLTQLEDKTEEEIASTYTVYSNIAYGTDSLQMMDIHKSGSANTLKDKNFTIVYLHGGGWYVSDKLQEHEMAFVQPYLRKGMNVVNMNYTLKKGALVTLEDISTALNFLSENNDQYQLNLDKVILTGFSAGGTIAATLGLSHNSPDNPFRLSSEFNVAGIIDFSGPVDDLETVEKIFTDWAGEDEMKEIAQKIGYAMFPVNDQQTKDSLLQKIEAINYWDANDPGFLLWSGGQDNQIPPSTFTEFIAHLNSNPSNNKVIQIDSAGHYPSQKQMEAVYKTIFEFLDKK